MREFVSKKAKNIAPSGIRKFFDLAAGQDDIISLGVGEPDFVTPWASREAGISSIKKGYTQYTSNKGLVQLREEISRYLDAKFGVSFPADDIVITLGASEAIDITLRAIIDDGDEVLVPDPSYVSYRPCVELCGGVAVPVECDGENGFILTPENLEKAVSPRTKAIIFPYPNNPTGGVMLRKDVENILPFILKHDLFIISDEIYAELSYGEEHCSIASFPELHDRVALISGFSKAFAMTGWRVGYVCAPPSVVEALLKIHHYAAICAPSFAQYGALAGLIQCREDGFKCVGEMREEYDSRRKYVYKRLTEAGLTCFEPKGAFYIFPCVKSTGLSGAEFALALLEKEKIAVVPGDAFGEFGKDYVRISYAYSMKNLVIAMDKIKKFIDGLKNDKEKL